MIKNSKFNEVVKNKIKELKVENRKNRKDINTKDEWKSNNLSEIKSRMSGWQLESFTKSYNYKCKNGISLEKKRKIELND